MKYTYCRNCNKIIEQVDSDTQCSKCNNKTVYIPSKYIRQGKWKNKYSEIHYLRDVIKQKDEIVKKKTLETSLKTVNAP